MMVPPEAVSNALLPLPKKGLKTAAHWAEHDGGKVKEPVLDGAEPQAWLTELTACL